MTDFYSADISYDRRSERLFMRPVEVVDLYPLIKIHDNKNLLPRFNDEVKEWINVEIKNPFYLVCIQDMGVDGVSADTNRIIFTDKKDYMYFKLKWS